MLLSQLVSNPLNVLLTIGVFLFVLSVHEASHALAALWLGDRTAQRERRLTLNPLAHIDITGFLMLITVGFGWGKPVPFNPYNLRSQRFGPMLVAAAGPASNFLLSLLATFLLALIGPSLGTQNVLTMALVLIALMSMILGIFNLIPIPPLDGSKALLALLAHPRHTKTRALLEERGPYLLLGLVVLNIVLNVNVFSWIETAARWGVYRLLVLFGA